MNNAQIESFLTIVKTGSLNKAAELLYISQPTLTYRLKSLEEELGHTLFFRKRGQHLSVLTPEGKAFLPIAEQWRRAFSETESFKADRLQQEIRIASVDSLNAYAFIPLFQTLGTVASHLSIRTHYSYEIYALAERQEIDVGFVLQPYQIPDIRVTPLFSEKMYLVFGARPAEGKPCLHPLELDPAKEIYLDWGGEFRRWHERWFGGRAQPYVKIDTISLWEQFLREDSWAILPASVLAAFRQKTALTAVLPEEGPPDRICYMISSRHSPLDKCLWAPDFFGALDGFLREKAWLTRLWRPVPPENSCKTDAGLI